jgi:hypothetical protein
MPPAEPGGQTSITLTPLSIRTQISMVNLS